ncbi:hypothetical protein FA95DRAFT_1503777, partial [Auriscalpium vulgare]
MQCASPEALIDAIYDGIGSNPPPPCDYFLNRMILAPRNDEVDSVNAAVLERFAGEEQVFLSADTV